MKGFVVGIIFTMIVLAFAIYEGAKQGYIYLGADHKPSFAESTFAMSVLDASIQQHIVGLQNPVTPTEENIEAGAKVYLAHCAGCHGVPANPDSQFSQSFNPPVPGFFKEPPDMSEAQNFYIVQHGVRWTGMPSFGATLSDQQIWQAVTFLSHITNISPATRKIFDPPTGTVADAR
jgi:mono/diheme cytochrome c family protein